MLALFFTALSRRGWTLGFCSHPSLVQAKASPQECGGLFVKSLDGLTGCICVCPHDSVLAVAFLAQFVSVANGPDWLLGKSSLESS